MSVAVSRRKIATHIADELAQGRPIKPLMQQVAAYLIDRGLVAQTDLMVHDIQAALARDHKVVLAEVTSAHALSDVMAQNIRQFVADAEGADTVQVSTSVDPALLGGVIVRTPRAVMDTSIKKQLNELRA